MEEEKTTVSIIPDFANLHDQFMRQFEDSIKRSIRDAVVDDEYDSLAELREGIVFLNIAIQSIDTIEAFVTFRSRLLPIVDELAVKHDKLKHDFEYKGKCQECGGDLQADGHCESCDPTEPDEDAIKTEDHRRFFQYGKLAFTFEDGEDGDEPAIVIESRNGKPHRIIQMPDGTTVEAAIRRYMDEEQFWPDAWFISDHGNAHRIDLTQGVRA